MEIPVGGLLRESFREVVTWGYINHQASPEGGGVSR